MIVTETTLMQTQLDLPRDVSEGLRHVPRAILLEELRALIEKQKSQVQVQVQVQVEHVEAKPDNTKFDNLPPQIAEVVAAIEASGGVSTETVEKMKKSSKEFREEFWLDKDDG